MSDKTEGSQKPPTEPLSDIGKEFLDSLRRYGGRPDLLAKEHPELVRKPMPDPGKKKAPQTTR